MPTVYSIDPIVHAFNGEAMAAVQRAVVASFTEEDWLMLGYTSGTNDYIVGHSRLLRSLSWNDPDYGRWVFEALQYFLDHKPDAIRAVIDHERVRNVLRRDAPQVLSNLGIEQLNVPPPPPRQLSAGEAVERALADADHLINVSGPVSAVDRLHTALHGYIRLLAANAGSDALPGVTVTRLFKELRTRHHAFRCLDADEDASRMLSGLATVIDSLNSMRNNASVAHPNQVLLGEDEAHLAVNATRTLFHYLFAKSGMR